MNASPVSTNTHRRRAACAAATATLLVAAVACASGTDTATPATSGATTTSAPPPTPAPPPTTVAPPPTTSTPHTTPTPPTTSTPDSARHALLSSILESHRAAGEFVGARIALQDPDGTITEAVSGTQSVDSASAPVDLDVPWNIGSSTKTFVAVVVLQLADEGRLDLDATIDAYIHDLAGADQITPRQLLLHTSGLNEYINDPAVLSDAQRKWQPAELIAVAEAASRTGDPGGPHRYSNTNYIVLGEIIAQVTGNSWADEVRTRITEPLGMTATSEIGPDDHPVGYKVIDDAFVDWTSGTHPSVGGAAGALQSTGRDLLRFARALADGTLLSPHTQAAMHTFVPAEDLSQFGIDHGYGLGLERYTNEAITVIGHMGTGEAQSAYVGYDADRGTAVAVGTNTAIPGPQALMAVEALLAASQPG